MASAAVGAAAFVRGSPFCHGFRNRHPKGISIGDVTISAMRDGPIWGKKERREASVAFVDGGGDCVSNGSDRLELAVGHRSHIQAVDGAARGARHERPIWEDAVGIELLHPIATNGHGAVKD